MSDRPREPVVTYATIRDGCDEWHLECRFSDGQKFAAVIVDKDFEGLAEQICADLNRHASNNNNEERIQRVMEALRSRFLATSYDHAVHWRDMAIAAIEAADLNRP